MANNIGKLAKQATKPTDEVLKFIQQSFNTKDISFVEIIRQLDAYANSPSEVARMQNEDIRRKAEAARLRDQLSKITILTDLDKYKKFDKLGNFGLDSKGLRETYKVSDEIIKDIQVARKWLASYNQFRLNNSVFKTEDLHDELLILGKSILGRAIELTPMKTGNLRQSGTLYDFGTYVIIAFTAPYASYVHENMEIIHPNHASNPNCGGRAKFLEIALQEFFPDRTVWTEQHGFGGVEVKIGINPLLLEYKHYE